MKHYIYKSTVFILSSCLLVANIPAFSIGSIFLAPPSSPDILSNIITVRDHSKVSLFRPIGNESFDELEQNIFLTAAELHVGAETPSEITKDFLRDFGFTSLIDEFNRICIILTNAKLHGVRTAGSVIKPAFHSLVSLPILEELYGKHFQFENLLLGRNISEDEVIDGRKSKTYWRVLERATKEEWNIEGLNIIVSEGLNDTFIRLHHKKLKTKKRAVTPQDLVSALGILSLRVDETLYFDREFLDLFYSDLFPNIKGFPDRDLAFIAYLHREQFLLEHPELSYQEAMENLEETQSDKFKIIKQADYLIQLARFWQLSQKRIDINQHAEWLPWDQNALDEAIGFLDSSLKTQENELGIQRSPAPNIEDIVEQIQADIRTDPKGYRRSIPTFSPSRYQKSRFLRGLFTQYAVGAPGAINALSGRKIDKRGWFLTYLSGAVLSNSVFGVPDIGLTEAKNTAAHAQRVDEVSQNALLTDVDTGWATDGSPDEVEENMAIVWQYVDAVHLEDQTKDKKCGHLTDKCLVSVAEMQDRIRAANRAKKNPHQILIARTDAAGVKDNQFEYIGFEGAVHRALAYLEAGADGIFPEALKSKEEFERFARRIRERFPHVILLANMTDFGKSPYLTLEEFSEVGYNIVIWPVTMQRIASHAMHIALHALYAGSQVAALGGMQSRSELYGDVDYGSGSPTLQPVEQAALAQRQEGWKEVTNPHTVIRLQHSTQAALSIIARAHPVTIAANKNRACESSL